MYTASRKSFPKTTTFNMVVEIESNLDRLREIQKDCFSKIKNKFYRAKALSKIEVEYLWNLYYNFTIREYQFDEEQLNNVTTFTTMNHVGMKMLHNMK